MFKTYTPQPCKAKNAKFKGEVVLKIPSYEDRLEMIAENPEILEAAGQDQENKSGISTKNLKIMLAMIKWSYKFYEKVDITRSKDGKRFDSLDCLRYDKECQDIIQDVATQLSQGFELGEI